MLSTRSIRVLARVRAWNSKSIYTINVLLYHMVKYKISQKHAECIGCQACVNVCPDNWVMDADGKAKPKKKIINASELDCNKQAESTCPVQIIKISKVK